MAKLSLLSPRAIEILIMFADGATMKPLGVIENSAHEYVCVPNINHTRALMRRGFLEFRTFENDGETYKAWVISDDGREHAKLHGWSGLVYDQPEQEPLRFQIGEMAIDNFGNLVTISKIKTDGPYPLYGFGNDHWCHADWLTKIDPLLNTGLVYDQPAPKFSFPLVIDVASWERMVNAELAHQDAEDMHAVLSGVFETNMLYDQPQPFTFDFKRGDVVEFQFAFPRTPAHKGWLRGIFYNVYPGDTRYGCVRYQGQSEAARLADIRKPLPVVVDIFDGMGDFDVKASDSAKAA